MPPSWEKNILGRSFRSWGRAALAWAVVAQAVALFGQTPESLGRAYRQSPAPVRRQALERFAAAHKDIDGALAHLTLGIAAYEQKQFPDAIQHLSAAQSRLPKLADYIAYYLGSARLETGDSPAAARNAASVRTVPLNSPLAAKSIVVQARALATSGAAREGIRMLLASYSDLPQPDGDLSMAIAYEAARDLPHAVAYYQRVYYEYPDSDQAVRAAAALIALHDTMGATYAAPSPQQMVDRGNQFLAQREYPRARSEFEALVPQLTGPERDQARVGIGAADYFNGNVAASYQYLRSLDVSGSEADAERLYYLVECARRLNDDEEMMRSIQKLSRHYGESPWRFKALLSAANRFLVTNQHEKYAPLYKAAYETFPSQPQAASCHWKVAWDAYIHRKHDAGDLLHEHLARYPANPSASGALYFLGRLAESDKDYDAARTYYTRLSALFPNYYYGLLAREHLTQPKIITAGPSSKTARFLETIAFPPRKSASPSQPDAQTSLRIARARLLKSAGLPDLAETELRFGARNDSQPLLLAIELAHTANAPHERLHSIKSMAPDYLSMSLKDAPPAFWELLFPLPYQKDLVRNARAQNLDPYIVAALIRQESEFNPQALSAKRAYGLTQVEPATGRSLARRAGVRNFSNRSLFQPATNLKLGTYYLRALLDQWGGQWEQTLASYNAGKSRVNDWITWNTYQEPAEFVESIPFAETREYVQAVMRNAAVYRQLYATRAVPANAGPGSHKPARPRHARPPAAV